MENKILEAKLNGYGSAHKRDFALERELTVTITLGEYRELVKSVATKERDIEKANADKFVREDKIKKLETENSKLKEEMHELKKRMDEEEEE